MLSAESRVLIIFDLLKDGDVIDDAVYSKLDKANSAQAKKMLKSAYDARFTGGAEQGIFSVDPSGAVKEWKDLTDEERFSYFILATRAMWTAAHGGASETVAAAAAAQAAKDKAKTESKSVLG